MSRTSLMRRITKSATRSVCRSDPKFFPRALSSILVESFEEYYGVRPANHDELCALYTLVLYYARQFYSLWFVKTAIKMIRNGEDSKFVCRACGAVLPVTLAFKHAVKHMKELGVEVSRMNGLLSVSLKGEQNDVIVVDIDEVGGEE